MKILAFNLPFQNLLSELNFVAISFISKVDLYFGKKYNTLNIEHLIIYLDWYMHICKCWLFVNVLL